MFEQSLVLPSPTNKRWTFAASLGLQCLGLGVLALLPLVFTDQLSRVNLRSVLFPPPPPPPPVPMQPQPAQQTAARAQPRRANLMEFVKPKSYRPLDEIRDRVFEEAPSVDSTGPCTNCVYSGPMPGIPGGTGMHASTVPPPPPPAPPAVVEKKPEPTKTVRQGGDVQAAKLVRRVIPVYPQLAKQARVSGTVKLMSMISKDGTVQQLQVVSGHPLLVGAALEAVRQWVYRPTLLNGEPVEVIAPIDVNFTLNSN